MSEAPATDAPPNVLLICVDHWSGLLLGAAGHPVVMTPTIDQLARSGAMFTRAYSACPTCIPARRTLMTGLSSRSHGDRTFRELEPMPDVPTLAQCFRDAGYQAYAAGKLHVYPQRDRIGFDDVILNEEGRRHLGGGSDDWELYLQERGFAGLEYASGLCNNDYVTRAWPLPEDCHPTNWAAREMCRLIRRRDPRRPGFWYLSFVGPHPPVWPLRDYLELYRDVELDEPVIGDWSRDMAELPYAAAIYNSGFSIRQAPRHARQLARRAFYACITHIDHQVRVVLGTLREAGLIDNTIIAFTADHGDMLGDHHLWAKGVPYEMSNRVPLVILPRQGDERLGGVGARDDRLVELRDVMPTLLDLAGLPVPGHVEGFSLLSDRRREHLYGEHWENERAARMVRDERFKLVYYPTGNRFQLFDLDSDPREQTNLAGAAEHRDVQDRLTQTLVGELYGSDEQWLRDGTLVGLPQRPVPAIDHRGLVSQRGLRYL